MEIPTYPYKEEFGYNLKGLSRRFLDMAFVQLFKNHVDRFITYSTHQKINGVEAIQTGNGYSFESIEPIIKNKKNNFIVFTTVACFQRWHGIDRFISSLKLYRKPGVIFNVVGNGSALPALKEMVNKDDYLKKIVIFHGFLSFENMKKIYEKTDIAVGCLGCHRKNIGQIQPLKNREYIAMGLPLIFSTKDRLVPWHLPFVYKIKDDESLFDIEDIIRWYKNGCFDSRKIYEYGKKNLSWYKQLEIVVENFQ
jgi:hypothetical protein